ncbi:fungal-specific transcription factor domain-containing protein [Whalleya microplaca]|nr:fungal-specific transcription factor domain-containing protein [Whalleya microplaca]
MSLSRKRIDSLSDLNDEFPSKRRKKPTACRPCHSRKVKCPGGEPCSNCQQSKCPQDCTYPVRDQKVMVSNSYIEKLIAENQRLREQTPRLESEKANEAPAVSHESTKGSREQRDSARNPLLDDGSWFVPLVTFEMPGLVGEAADTAFATRFRQALADDPNVKHFPRTHYVFDSTLASLADSECPWPPVSRARLLVKFALDTVGSCYHCVRRSEVYSGLKQHYRNLVSNMMSSDTAFACKLLALFALGEVYSSRKTPTSESDFPGLSYYARASRILRNLRERPHIDTVEILLLLSLYSLLMNRRYSAHFLASTAVRLATIMGMHQDMPELHFPDRAAREHRARVWWTAYTVDRLLASEMGHPVSIQDDDIAVDLPSSEGLSETESSDFLDVEYVNASIRLARISRDIITSIYNRRATHIAFSKRVQKTLSDLRGWVSALPRHLQIETGETARPLPRHIKWLHLSFNQLVILATRPILLLVFRTHRNLWATPLHGTELKQEIGETTLALAEACIRCARHSQQLLTESWIDGSFLIFDYTYAQYLFSAATILAVSSLSIGKNEQDDKDGFETANQFLEQMKENGTFAAREFCRHFDHIRYSIATFLANNNGRGGVSPTDTGLPFLPLTNAMPLPLVSADSVATPPYGFQPTMTAEMALAEPSLQDFLTQADLDLGFLDTQMQDTRRFQSLYIPATFQDTEWTPR